MSRSSLKTLVLKKRPHGRYNYIVDLSRNRASLNYSSSNYETFKKILAFMKANFKGSFRYEKDKNYMGENVVSRVYIERKSDFFLLKMVFNNDIFKSYKVVTWPELSKQDSDQTAI